MMKTNRLIFIIFVIFLVARGYEFPGNTSLLVKSGGCLSTLVWNGEPFRLLTAVFLHIGWAHLIMNCVSLFFLGKILENLYRFRDILGVFIITGIAGNYFSMMGSEVRISAGASGGICGLLGLYLLFWLKYRNLFETEVVKQQIGEIFWIIGINAFYGFSVSNVDNYAHFGGGITGLILGIFLMSRFDPKCQFETQRRSSLISIAGVILLFVGGVWGLSVSFQIESGKYLPEFKKVRFGNKRVEVPLYWNKIDNKEVSILMRDEMGLGAQFISLEPPIEYFRETDFQELFVEKRYGLIPINFKRSFYQLENQKEIIILEFDGVLPQSVGTQKFWSGFICENQVVLANIGFFYVSEYVWVRENVFIRICESLEEITDGN